MISSSTFGQIVKAHRRERGLTQDEQTRRVGGAPVTLRKTEYDDLRSAVWIAERLAAALNILIDQHADLVRCACITRDTYASVFQLVSRLRPKGFTATFMGPDGILITPLAQELAADVGLGHLMRKETLLCIQCLASNGLTVSE